MDHIFCLNQNSFPADTYADGKKLFLDAIEGMLELQRGTDRFLLYLDSNGSDLYEYQIAPDLTVEKFIAECADPDMSIFLSELEDKSPALDSISDELIEEMSSYSFYMHGFGVDAHADDYSIAWVTSGYLLSIATQDRWRASILSLSRTDENGRYIEEILTLNNISEREHGLEHSGSLEFNCLSDVIGVHTATNELLIWFSEQTQENKFRIIEKVRLSVERSFSGGKPLFETLTNGGGLREIRISAHGGGAIRILFKNLCGEKVALLCGFIKYADSEGYTQAMKKANSLYKEFKREQLN